MNFGPIEIELVTHRAPRWDPTGPQKQEAQQQTKKPVIKTLGARPVKETTS